MYHEEEHAKRDGFGVSVKTGGPSIAYIYLKRLLKLGFILGILGFISIVVVVLLYTGEFNVIVEFIRSLGWLGNIVIIVAVTIIGLPIPIGYTPLGIISGYLYGILWGSLTMLVGTLLGSAFGYWVTRVLFRQWYLRRIENSPYLLAFMRTIEKKGFLFVLLTRMAPIPFGVQNSLFSVVDIHACGIQSTFFWFMLATIVGVTPEIVALVYSGSTLGQLESLVSGTHWKAQDYAILALQIGVTVILLVALCFLSREAVRQVRKQRQEEEETREIYVHVNLSENTVMELDSEDHYKAV